MAYTEEKFFTRGTKFSKDWRVSILQDGGPGAGERITAKGKFFTKRYPMPSPREFWKRRIVEPILEVTIIFNPDDDLTFYKNIAQSTDDTYRLRFQYDGSTDVIGSIKGGFVNINEKSAPKTITLRARPLTLQKVNDFNLPLGRSPINYVQTIGELANTAGFDLPLYTYNDWEGDALAGTTDYLWEAAIDQYHFRDYAGTKSEDTAFTQYEALESVIPDGFIFFMADGAWHLMHIPYIAKQDGTSVQRYRYTWDGASYQQDTSSTVNLRQPLTGGQYLLRHASDSDYHGGIKRIDQEYNHKTAISSLSFEPSYLHTGSGNISSESMEFNTDGSQRISISGRVLMDVVESQPGEGTAQFWIRAGTWYWDGTNWVDSPATIPRLDVAVAGNADELFTGSISITTDTVPSADEIEVQFEWGDAQQVDGTSLTVDDIEWRGWALDIINTTDAANSAGITYRLTQSQSYSTMLELPDRIFGQGPTPYSRGRITDNIDGTLVENWGPKGGTIDQDYASFIMGQIMNTQRNGVRVVNAELWSEYRIGDVVEYESDYFLIIGGDFNGKDQRWDGYLYQLNYTTGSDTLTTIYDQGGQPSTGVTGGSGSSSPGITQSIADDRYFNETELLGEIAVSDQNTAIGNLGITATKTELNRLDGTLATVRQNLGVEIGVDVQAWDAELDTLSGMTASQATGLVGTSGTATLNNLEVTGTINYVNENNLQVEDKTITVNKNGTAGSAENAGVIVENPNGDDSLLWDSTNGWVLSDSALVQGTLDTTGALVRHYSDEATKTDWRLTLNMLDADQFKVYGFDEGGTAFKPVQIGGTSTNDSGLVVDENGLATANGGITVPSGGVLRLLDTTDVTLGGTGHAFQIGLNSADNLAIDNNEIQARNNGSASTLNLNIDGGLVEIGASVGGGLTVHGLTTLSDGLNVVGNADVDGMFSVAETTADVITMYRDSAFSNGQGAFFTFSFNNSNGVETPFARLVPHSEDATAGAEEGDLDIRVADGVDGSVDTVATFGATNLSILTTASFSGEITGSGGMTIPSGSVLRLEDITDVTLASTGHAFQIGLDSGQNLALDGNEVQSRNNGAAAALNLNADGGLVEVGANTGGGLTVNGLATLNDGATVSGDLTVDTNTLFVDASEDAVGFGTTSVTSGFVVDINGDGLVREDLQVNGGLFAAEFVVEQTRVMTDFRMSVGGGRVKTVTGSAGTETITLEDDFNNANPFAAGDIVLIQQRTGAFSGTIIKRLYREVASISGLDVTFQTTNITWTTGTDDTGSIAPGDDVTIVGATSASANTATRDHYIHYDIAGVNTPAIRWWDGVQDVGGGSEIMRAGGLNGYDGSFGAQEIGLAGKISGNLAFAITDTQGLISGFSFDTGSLYTDQGTTEIALGDDGQLSWSSNVYGLQVGSDIDNRMFFGELTGDYDMRVIVGGSTYFQAGSVANSIAGANFDADHMWGGAASLGSATAVFDWATPKIGLGASADSIDLTTGTGFYANGSGHFKAGSTSDYVKWDGTNIGIVAQNLTVDVAGGGSSGYQTADFFLDSTAQQMSLGGVFSADGSNDSGNIASWDYDTTTLSSIVSNEGIELDASNQEINLVVDVSGSPVTTLQMNPTKDITTETLSSLLSDSKANLTISIASDGGTDTETTATSTMSDTDLIVILTCDYDASASSAGEAASVEFQLQADTTGGGNWVNQDQQAIQISANDTGSVTLTKFPAEYSSYRLRVVAQENSDVGTAFDMTVSNILFEQNQPFTLLSEKGVERKFGDGVIERKEDFYGGITIHSGNIDVIPTEFTMSNGFGDIISVNETGQIIDIANTSISELKLNASTTLRSQIVYDNTTANSANVNVDSDGIIRRSTSARKYKQDIQDLSERYTSSLEAIQQLRPRLYKDINDKSEHVGLVADEVEQIMPEVVGYHEGQPDWIEYDKIVAPLIGAMQELTKEVEKIKARLSTGNRN